MTLAQPCGGEIDAGQVASTYKSYEWIKAWSELQATKSKTAWESNVIPTKNIRTWDTNRL